MATELSRVDRLTKSYAVADFLPGGVSGTISGVSLALLPVRSNPTAATVWTAATYADGVVSVLLAGPDADSTGALVVPATADLWMKVTDTPEVDAEKVERLTVLGGGAQLAAPVGVPVVSVNGKTGSAVVLSADDVGAQDAATLAADAATHISDGSALDVALRAAFGTGGVSPAALVDNLPTPLYIAHRMGTDQSAEECMTAARIAVAQGAQVLEIDMRFLADGTLVASHDSTVDRVTDGTGNVADLGLASWMKLKMDHAGAVGGTGWPDEAPLTVERILREFGNKVALAPEPYDAGAYAAFDKLVTALGIDRRTIILQPIFTSDATAAIAAGYRCISLGATEPTPTRIAELAALGYWGISTDIPVTTPAVVAACHANGLKAIPYTASGHFVRDKMLALGVDGMFTEGPGYAQETFAKRTTDTFAAQARTPGTAPLAGSGAMSYQAPNILRITGNLTVRLGYLVPPDPSNFVVNFQGRLVADGGNTGSALFLFVNQSDFFSTDSRTTQSGVTLDTSDGYRFAAQASNTGLFGVLLNNNVQGSNIMTSGASSYALNTWADYRLTVTPTQLKWEQVGVAGPVFLNRAEYRPLRYIGLGATSVATAEFRNIVIT